MLLMFFILDSIKQHLPKWWGSLCSRIVVVAKYMDTESRRYEQEVLLWNTKHDRFLLQDLLTLFALQELARFSDRDTLLEHVEKVEHLHIHALRHRIEDRREAISTSKCRGPSASTHCTKAGQPCFLARQIIKTRDLLTLIKRCRCMRWKNANATTPVRIF